jgi:phosphatidylethanolamine/phosphatidyl-N-methylethanolamine N-methyltransferase
MNDFDATALTRVRYNHIAGLYDRLEFLMEFRAKKWRKHLWDQVRPGKILEVGVGTGKNMPYYPAGAEMYGIDLSDGMLAQARDRAKREQIAIDLREMDVQALNFPTDSFDTAVATFVFCSVPDPVLGMQALARVVKSEGKILLLEHVRLEGPWSGRLMDFLNPLVVRVVGANINRRTVENVRAAGLVLESVEDLTTNGLVKLIQARPNKPALEKVQPPSVESSPGGRTFGGSP